MAVYISRSDTINVAAISDQIYRQKRQNFIFEKFTSITSPVTEAMAARGQWPAPNRDGIIRMIPNPFAYKKGAKGGGNRHVIPMQLAEYGDGVSGDTQVMGTGTTDTLYYCEVYVNRKRKEKIYHLGEMTELYAGGWAAELARRTGPELMDWLMRWTSWYGIAYALTRGYSKHIIGSGAGEFSITERHHPNLYCCGLTPGRGDGNTYATWSITTATYEQNLSRNVIRVVDATANHMTAENVRLLYGEAIRNRLKPVNGDPYNPRFVMLLHIDQWQQLISDPEVYQHLQNWANHDQSSVWAKMGALEYGGFYIFWGLNGPCQIFSHKADGDLTTAATSANATKVEYGPLASNATEKDVTDPANIDSATDGTVITNKRMGLVLGIDALVGIKTRDPRMLTEDWDYRNKEGMDIDYIFGYARSDFYNNDTVSSATAVENTSSIPFVTYSPRAA